MEAVAGTILVVTQWRFGRSERFDSFGSPPFCFDITPKQFTYSPIMQVHIRKDLLPKLKAAMAEQQRSGAYIVAKLLEKMPEPKKQK
jgi:hypothetical protein